MWLENLKELKKEKGMSTKQIAEKTNLPERTVARVLSGDTDAPRIDTLCRIVAALGGSIHDIFAESGSVLASPDVAEIQAEANRLSAEITAMREENAILKKKVADLSFENEKQRLTIEHQSEIIALHNYYNNLKKNG